MDQNQGNVITSPVKTQPSSDGNVIRGKKNQKKPQLSKEEQRRLNEDHKRQEQERRDARDLKRKEDRERKINAIDHLKAWVLTVKSFIGKHFLTIFKSTDFYHGLLRSATDQIGGIPSEVTGPLNDELIGIMLQLDEWNVKAGKIAKRYNLSYKTYDRPDFMKDYRNQLAARKAMQDKMSKTEPQVAHHTGEAVAMPPMATGGVASAATEPEAAETATAVTA